ncbi:HNH endonuclease signature motif containing protein [Kribbella sp. NPDC058245]|uniref:HNH endonuclease signature motif containing protein n=1 Tax=Kribbella sp. NPDC058245 TaxID=3346399 RepID=UPI0036E144CF
MCGAPPVMCDAHHLISWIDGGITAVSNLVLLCRVHHVDLHAGKWVVTITNGQVRVAKPTWAEPPSRRRRLPAGSSPESSFAAAPADAAACASGANEFRTGGFGTDQLSTDQLRTGQSSMHQSSVNQPGVDERGVNGLAAAEFGGSGWVRTGSGESREVEGSLLAATDLRAATRAVWGEDSSPEPSSRPTRLSEGGDFDPWGEADQGPASPPCAPR